MMTPPNAHAILNNAELLYSAETVQAAIQRLAEDISRQLANTHPLVLAVMGGAVVFTGQLLPHLQFPLDFDYIHVSRYDKRTTGGTLTWHVEPKESVSGRTVLILDDILDEGETMAAIHQRLMELGARTCFSAVFANKLIAKTKPITADFVGIDVPDRYIFGFGMDIHGLWRNLPAIYALKK